MTGEHSYTPQVGLLNDSMDKIFAEFQKLHLRIDALDQKVERRTKGVRGRQLRRPSVDLRRNGKDVVCGSVVPKDEEEVEGFEEEEEEENRPIVRRQCLRYDDNLNSIKQKIPQFLGKHDPNAYIAWEEHINRIFDLNNYSEGKKDKLVFSEFHGYASTWWADMERRRKRDGDPPIATWRELSRILWKSFVPTFFQRQLRSELMDLRQGSLIVMDYYHEMRSLMLKSQLEEDEQSTESRFLHGLNMQIRQRLEMQGFVDIDDLVEKAELVEKHLKEARSRMTLNGGNKPSSNFKKSFLPNTYSVQKFSKPLEKGPTSEKVQKVSNIDINKVM